MSNDEQELIAQILDGNQELYSRLIDRHKDAVYRHCFYSVRDEDIAEDITQETFIRAYTNLVKYDAGKASFKTWLFVIATRQCLSYLRQHRTLPIYQEDYVQSTYDSTDKLARDQEVHAAVMRLKPKYRTVISLYYWHGYRYDQIAQAMDVPIGSVRGWIHRAKQQLKEALS